MRITEVLLEFCDIIARMRHYKTEAEFGRRLTLGGAVACYTLLYDVMKNSFRR